MKPQIYSFLLAGVAMMSSCSDYAYDPGDPSPARDPMESAVDKAVTINPSITYQTMQGIGASDCWMGNWVGRDWTGAREGIARLMFSQQIVDGQPQGIGMSMWRVNAGAGSAERGDKSGVQTVHRRAESFRGENGGYDWSKCAGQQYFMQKAREMGTEKFVLFSNSPLVEYTYNGQARNDRGNKSNLLPSCYGKFADYLADVTRHFTDEGYNITHISPINEPNVSWNGHDQEGSAWTIDEAARLTRELDKNLALRVTKNDNEDKWNVYGRGVLHLSVLIETMRREGYELQVGQPQVIIKEIDGVKCEPVELLTINVTEEYASKMIDMVTRRKGDLVSMTTQNDRVHMEFQIPSRGIIGLRNNVLTGSAGEAIMAHRFMEYQPWKGDIERRTNGSLIAMEAGTAYAYAIDKLQDRGRFFIFPQEEVYAGQVVGESAKDKDIVINVTKSKKLTNMRASGADDKAKIVPPVVFSLEEALEYIKEDEYVEVTPNHLRLRKIILDELERKRANKN